MIYRDVVQSVQGLVDYLRVERTRVPGEVLIEADRLECLLLLVTIRTSTETSPQASEMKSACHLGLMAGGAVAAVYPRRVRI